MIFFRCWWHDTAPNIKAIVRSRTAPRSKCRQRLFLGLLFGLIMTSMTEHCNKPFCSKSHFTLKLFQMYTSLKYVFITAIKCSKVRIVSPYEPQNTAIELIVSQKSFLLLCSLFDLRCLVVSRHLFAFGLLQYMTLHAWFCWTYCLAASSAVVHVTTHIFLYRMLKILVPRMNCLR